jgi:hypothetical protein
VQGLGGGHSEPRDANPPEDAVRWEVRHDFNEKARARREGEQAWIVSRRTAKGRGVVTFRSGSSGKGEEDGEITLPLLSSLRITPPPLCDIVCR